MNDCDVCGKEAVETVTVSRTGGNTFVVSLCGDEMKTVEEWQKAGSDKPRGKRSPRRPAAHKVVPID